MNGLARLRRTLDGLTLYSPLIIMALLAMSSWWLVRSMPELLQTEADKPLRTDPDFKLHQFTVKSFDTSGRMTRQISGVTATHFPAVDELHIERIRIFAETEVGSQFSAHADQGVSSENDNKFTLTGDVHAVRKADAHGPLTRLQGEQLTAIIDQDRLLSSVPVEIIRDRDVFTSDTLDFNTRTGQYLLQGRVRSVIAPRPSKP